MGKPENADEARSFLKLLSGRRHKVITAVSVTSNSGVQRRDVVSAVRMKRLSDQEIAEYLATDDWVGKAGAYAIQGPAGAFIPWIEGSFSAIMGLPVHETTNLLKAAGYVWGEAL